VWRQRRWRRVEWWRYERWRDERRRDERWGDERRLDDRRINERRIRRIDDRRINDRRISDRWIDDRWIRWVDEWWNLRCERCCDGRLGHRWIERIGERDVRCQRLQVDRRLGRRRRQRGKRRSLVLSIGTGLHVDVERHHGRA
jgi:hypothetical protein